MAQKMSPKNILLDGDVQKLTSRWTGPLSDQVQKHKTGYDRYNINMIMALFRECFWCIIKIVREKDKTE